MRYFLSFLFLLTQLAPASSQFVCFSDSTTIYEFPGADLPVIIGAATFPFGHFTVVVGGKFQDVQNPDSLGAYNCDMLVVDAQVRKTYVLPLSYFPPYVADQFSGIHYCYTMDGDTAYVMGGYGYDLAKGYEVTFPTMTIFSVKTLIDSVLQHKDYLDLFTAIDDNRLAVTEGGLQHLGAYFLVYGGKEIKPIVDEFTDCRTVSAWDFNGQLRKFRLSNLEGYPEVDEFQICTTSKAFYQCLPGKWGSAPKVQERKQHDQ